MELNPPLDKAWGRCLETFWCLTRRNDTSEERTSYLGALVEGDTSHVLPEGQPFKALFPGNPPPFQALSGCLCHPAVSLCAEGGLALVTLCCSSEQPLAPAKAPLFIWQMLCFLPIHGKCWFFCWDFKSSSFSTSCSCLEQCSLFLFFLSSSLQWVFSHLEQCFLIFGAWSCNLQQNCEVPSQTWKENLMLTFFSFSLVSPSFETESWLAAGRGFL